MFINFNSIILLVGLFHFTNLSLFVQASITLQHNNFTYSTFDVFGAAVEFYDITGVLMAPQFSQNSSCRLITTNSTNTTAVSSPPSENATSTILLVSSSLSKNAGCASLNDVYEEALAYNRRLVLNGGLPISSVIYSFVTLTSNTLTGPFSPLYISNQFSLPGSFGIPFILLPQHDNDQVHALIQSTPVVATLKQERGPWNDVILSPAYRAFIWFMFSVNLFLILRTLAILILLAKSKKLEMELRTVVVIIALVSTIIFTSQFPLNCITFEAQIIGQFSYILSFIAIYMLLLSWESVQTAMRIERPVTIMRVIIYSCLVLHIFSYSAHLFGKMYFISYYESSFSYVVSYFNIILSSASAFNFLYYGFFFVRKQDDYQISLVTCEVMSRMSYISFSCFISYFILAASNIMVKIPFVRDNIAASITCLVLFYLANTIRSFVLLFTLGMRISPESVPANLVNCMDVYNLWVQLRNNVCQVEDKAGTKKWDSNSNRVMSQSSYTSDSQSSEYDIAYNFS
ncbi:hypothetical protein BDF19DRAFT_443178 [Syncephalis fuscata]|nr:hypothetical protein BDF19DRAFT_443178 [Syncephalis fuscata]